MEREREREMEREREREDTLASFLRSAPNAPFRPLRGSTRWATKVPLGPKFWVLRDQMCTTKLIV